jgi:hypothetical protein
VHQAERGSFGCMANTDYLPRGIMQYQEIVMSRFNTTIKLPGFGRVSL